VAPGAHAHEKTCIVEEFPAKDAIRDRLVDIRYRSAVLQLPAIYSELLGDHRSAAWAPGYLLARGEPDAAIDAESRFRRQLLHRKHLDFAKIKGRKEKQVCIFYFFAATITEMMEQINPLISA
jgi:hypothetical protein